MWAPTSWGAPTCSDPAGAPGTEAWTGWWGDDPPFHTPVFVLSHHPRDPLTMKGRHHLHLRDSMASWRRWSQARAAAGDLKVPVAGGASTIAQFMAAGLLDELYLHVVPDRAG